MAPNHGNHNTDATWRDAREATVHAANDVMREIAESDHDTREKRARIAAIWRPLAKAISEAIRPDLPTSSPAAWSLAKRLGPDFVGQTSDTGRIVGWGADFGLYRPFVIHAANA